MHYESEKSKSIDMFSFNYRLYYQDLSFLRIKNGLSEFRIQTLSFFLQSTFSDTDSFKPYDQFRSSFHTPDPSTSASHVLQE